MTNYIPNEVKRFVPRDPPWINKQLKTLLNRKNRFLKNYKNMVIKSRTKSGLTPFGVNANRLSNLPKLLT